MTMPELKRSSTDRSYHSLAVVATVVLGLFFLAFHPYKIHIKSLLGPTDPLAFPPPLPVDGLDHPVDQLVKDADEKLQGLLNTETHTISEAAQAYRTRRGRHPPPGFDLWYDFAKKNNVSVIESFYDQISEDLEPFWSINPGQLRGFPATWTRVVSVRNDTVTMRTAVPDLWLNFWTDMLNNMPRVPDMDIAFSSGDDPRVMVSHARMVEHMKLAELARLEQNHIPLQQMRQDFQEYPELNSNVPDEEPTEGMRKFASEQEYWDHLVDACRPDDPIRQQPGMIPKTSIPPVHSTRYTVGSLKGYVSNITMARSVCHNPNLRTLHGYLICPFTFSRNIYTELRPIFAVTKLVGIGNDIIVPPPTHWLEKGTYAGAEHPIPWEEKKSAAVWRGVATGGNHTAANWYGFHRHRMMHVMNGTLQSAVEKELSESDLENPSVQALYAANPKSFDLGMHNFPFPLRHLYGLAAQSYGKLGEWMSTLTDAGFTNQHCSMDAYFYGVKTCPHTDAYYSVTPRMNMSDIMRYKYLPDVDGHTASGRFRGFVRSLSVPIKSSIFTEWHDRRLIPWRHYVPLSGEYQEWWGLLQYFIGYKGSEGEISIEGHDEIGKKIAHQGNDWSHHVERRENLLVYFYRVVLEYARICADDRVELGYVEDLLAELAKG